MSETSPANGSTPLNGWKEIASYVGRSVRAVQRWERELGFPVRRIHTAAGQTVYAFREEVDQWRAGLNPTRPESDRRGLSRARSDAESARLQAAPVTPAVPLPATPRNRRRALVWAGAAVVVLAGIGTAVREYWLRTSEAETIAKLQWKGNLLEAIDSQGRALWSQDFESPSARASEALDGMLLTDINGDSIPEVIAAVRFSEVGTQPVSDAIYALDSRGGILWKLVPTEVIRCGDESFAGPWRAKSVSIEDVTGPRRVWIAFVHNTWRPSFIVEVTPNGTSSLRYVQAGWIMSVANWTTPAGRLLAAGGLLNEFGRASLVVVDATGPTSTSPSDRGSFQCGGTATAGVRRMFLLPRLETTKPKTPYDFVVDTTIMGSDLQFRQEGQAVARIGPDLRLRDYALEDRFFRAHHEGETAGFIPHGIDRCPFLTATKDLAEWTQGIGWQDLLVAPLPRYPPATPRRPR